MIIYRVVWAPQVRQTMIDHVTVELPRLSIIIEGKLVGAFMQLEHVMHFNIRKETVIIG
jgi:hypothetical protein